MMPILSLLNLGIGGMLLIQVLARQGVNHWALNVLWFCPVALFSITWGLRRAATYPGQVDVISGMLLLIWLLTLDHGNLLVEHSRWCQRGMPSFGQFQADGR